MATGVNVCDDNLSRRGTYVGVDFGEYQTASRDNIRGDGTFPRAVRRDFLGAHIGLRLLLAKGDTRLLPMEGEYVLFTW